ncbi:MAG: hypothetical protein K6G20_08895 [Ruminococcus sp.]|nr:hypothetical protein [Ruminococcus sp.]
MSDEIELNENEVVVAKILFDFFRETKGESLITYKWLSDKSKEKGLRYEPDALCNVLDHINKWCVQINNEVPMISVIVINHKEGHPGLGFFVLRNNMHPERMDVDIHKAFLDEWKHVREFKEWESVFAELNK